MTLQGKHQDFFFTSVISAIRTLSIMAVLSVLTAYSGNSNAGWELLYNPSTREVYHLQPVNDVASRIITQWR